MVDVTNMTGMTGRIAANAAGGRLACPKTSKTKTLFKTVSKTMAKTV